jgi:hypothetical protein
LVFSFAVGPHAIWWAAVRPDTTAWRFGTACGSLVILISQVVIAGWGYIMVKEEKEREGKR